MEYKHEFIIKRISLLHILLYLHGGDGWVLSVDKLYPPIITGFYWGWLSVVIISIESLTIEFATKDVLYVPSRISRYTSRTF